MSTCGYCGEEVPKDSPCEWFCREQCQTAWNHDRIGQEYRLPQSWGEAFGVRWAS